MGGESSIWDAFRRVYGDSGHWMRVENSCGAGMPDVTGRCRGGDVDWWIELKYTREPPRRIETPVRLRHFTRTQRQWLMRHGSCGGCCGVLWKIGGRYYLFGWEIAPRLGSLTISELGRAAHWYGGTLRDSRLAALLQRGI